MTPDNFIQSAKDLIQYTKGWPEAIIHYNYMFICMKVTRLVNILLIHHASHEMCIFEIKYMHSSRNKLYYNSR